MGKENFSQSSFSEIKLKRPDGSSSPKTPDLVVDSKVIGKGYESSSSRAELIYDKSDAATKGLIFKRFNSRSMDKAERVAELLKHWNQLRSINQNQSKLGGVNFNLPPTIRGLELGDESGLLMTDLTHGGSHNVVDVKNIDAAFALYHRNERENPEGNPLVTKDQWRSIRKQILDEAELARVNGIVLCPDIPNMDEESLRREISPAILRKVLDPWLISIDKKGLSAPQVYLVDVNVFSRFFSPEEMKDPKNVKHCDNAYKAIEEALDYCSLSIGYLE